MSNLGQYCAAEIMQLQKIKLALKKERVAPSRDNPFSNQI
jgi:hypothetical protein